MAKPQRFEALDAWRGICALLVAFEHLSTASAIRHNALIRHSYRFVDFFFVLSGFVIAHAYRDRIEADHGEARPFLIRRIGRLWPLHATMLLVLVLVECGIGLAAHAGISIGHDAFTDRNTLGAIGPNLLLIHNWGFLPQTTWNTPSWSISTEMLAYLVFAATAAFAPRRATGWIFAAIGVGGAIVIATAAPEWMSSTADFGVFRCLYGFMAGVLARSLWSWRAPRLGGVGELAVIAAVGVAVALLPLDAPSLLATPLFAVAVWVFASEDGFVSRALKTRVPQALGAWSYSIYMVHVLISLALLTAALLATKHGMHVFARINGVPTITGSAAMTAALTLGYAAAVVGLASITYRHIELPGQRWFAGWARRGSAASPGAATSNAPVPSDN